MLAGVPYVVLLAVIFSMPGGDPAFYGGEGRIAQAFSQLYALGSGVLLWIVLGVVLLLGWINGAMPRWAAIGAAVLYPLSAIAAFVAVGAAYSYPGGWLVLVPALLPLLIALYAMWAHLAALHGVLRPDMTSAAALAAASVVIVATLPLAYVDELQFPARLARQDEESKALTAQREAEFAMYEHRQQAKFQRLTPDSPLRDYLDDYPAHFVDHEQAVAGARLVKSQQGDAERLLKEVNLYGLRELWRLDLEATPSLCEAFRAALLKVAIEDDLDRSVVERVEDQLPNMKWLVAEHCSLDDGLAAAKPKVRHVAAGNNGDSRWVQLLDAIVELRRKR
jgi:hypothetical protein